jgi:hypothetical protein
LYVVLKVNIPVGRKTLDITSGGPFSGKTQAWVGSSTAGGWPELSSPSTRCELDPQRMLGAPDDPARSTAAKGRAQPEFIGNCVGSDPRNLCAAV